MVSPMASGSLAIAATVTAGTPLARKPIPGPEPSEKSMELATIACCSLASPPKAMDSTARPCLDQIPFSVPISSGAKAKVVAEALPTRMPSAAGAAQVWVGQNRDRSAAAVIGCKGLDAVERPFGQKCGQGWDQADAEPRPHQFERHFVSAAMRDQTMRRQHALIPLLDPQCVLGPEMKLDAAVEHATNLGGSRVEVAYRIEVDRAWNREYIRVLDHRHLAEADAGLRDRFGCDQ